MQKEKEEQIKDIVANCKGLEYREWKQIKKFIDMEFDAICNKSTLNGLGEGTIKNIMQGLNW